MNLKLFLYRAKERLKRTLYLKQNGFCTVLLYHRVNDLSYDPQQLCVSVNNFRDQLSFLKKKYKFLTLEEFCGILKNKKRFPANSLLITFDDGYADNCENALPLLESLGLQAVFYIATKNIDTDELFWWDELDIVFREVKQKKINVNELLIKNNLQNSEQLYTHYVTKCKTVNSLNERNQLMAEVRTLYTVTESDKRDYAFLNATQLKRMSDSKSAVMAAHTINHLSLGHLSESDQYNEIKGSIDRLSKALGKKVEHFSFPYGEKTHFNQTTINICKELGMQSAAANYCDIVTPDDDVYSFPRFVVRNDKAEVLEQKIKKNIK